MSALDAAIDLRGVTKTFGGTTAVEDLDLVVPRGALYGSSGPTARARRRRSDDHVDPVARLGRAVACSGTASALEAKDRIGYLPEERGVYRKMRVGAFLTFIGAPQGRARSAGSRRACSARSSASGSRASSEKRCEELSKGMLQKVQFVAAIIHEPDLLILDEPFSGLDPVSTRLLRDLIVEEHRRGATILFSTHVMPQAEEICEHVVMIHRGRKVLDDPT